MDVPIEVLTTWLRHIREIEANLAEIRANLERRAHLHDLSKLDPIEFDAFVITQPKFRKANYGSPEYQECVDAIKPAIDHHYANNSHHTAYHPNGFEDMSLLDILEMLADWRAASFRNPTMTFEESLPKAFEKYNVPPNMQKHIMKTLRELGWI